VQREKCGSAEYHNRAPVPRKGWYLLS